MYVDDMDLDEAQEWLETAEDEGLTDEDIEDLRGRISELS